MAPRHDDRVRADALGDGHRLGAVTAEDARLIRRGGDNAARAVVADQHRLAAQAGVVELLDRREEGVHVHVKDRSRQSHGGILTAAVAGKAFQSFSGGRRLFFDIMGAGRGTEWVMAMAFRRGRALFHFNDRPGVSMARVHRAVAEPLERRVLFSTILWASATSGDFSTAANWQGGVVPG